MSQATRVTTAKERATIALSYIRKNATNGRAFDDCFEMGDGDQVVVFVIAKSYKDPRVMAFCERAGWMKEGKPTERYEKLLERVLTNI